ncbi:hypothetical protein HNQ56_003263 [Anaerotaenia torta]|uniref:hypothetical protein n=1 Tax=Anaerotaenia torta TaxID=433293 RepID=UPI003D1C4100
MVKISKVTDQISKTQREIYQHIINRHDFDFETVIIEKLKEQEEINRLPEHLAWIIAKHTFCEGQFYALQQFQLAKKGGNLAVSCLGIGLEYKDVRLRG